MGRASSRKKQRREDQPEDANLWQTPMPVDGGSPHEVIAHLADLTARLEHQRHRIHAADRAIADTAQRHHDNANKQIAAIHPDLAADPEDMHLARAHAYHLMQRRGAEEVHDEVSRRVGRFKPKL